MTIKDGLGANITTADQVDNTPAFNGLTGPQREWVIRLAQDQAIVATVEEAKRAATSARTTVVGGVDGQRGLPEMAFLVNLWQLNPKIIAYDPGMTNLVRTYADQKGATTLVLRKASIEQLGTHVPQIDVLVPHPGDWVTALAGDLASCLDKVLGPGSQADVLTDNEPKSPGYAAHLTSRIDEINTNNQGVQGYQPLIATTTTPTVTATMTERTVQFGSVTFKLGHEPQHRVVHVSRE